MDKTIVIVDMSMQGGNEKKDEKKEVSKKKKFGQQYQQVWKGIEEYQRLCKFGNKTGTFSAFSPSSSSFSHAVSPPPPLPLCPFDLNSVLLSAFLHLTTACSFSNNRTNNCRIIIATNQHLVEHRTIETVCNSIESLIAAHAHNANGPSFVPLSSCEILFLSFLPLPFLRVSPSSYSSSSSSSSYSSSS